MDFRRNPVDHPPLTIDTSTVERVSSTKFLGVHITEDLTWTTNTKSISKKAQQRLHFLRRLKRASLPPPILTTFYRGTIESVLTSCITVWYRELLCSRPQDPPANSEHRCKNHWCPSPLHPGYFPYTMLQQSKKYRGVPHPPLPQSLPAPTLRETVPEYQSPLRQTAQQLFPPGCESPELKSHRPSLKPQTTPPPHTHLTTSQEKTVKLLFLCNSGERACTSHL